MASAEHTIRPAVPEDIPCINAIHKHYVLNTVITFVTEPNTDEETQANFKKVTQDEELPYLVAIDSTDDTMLGYTYASSFRGMKPAYRHTLELSLFCHPDHVRKGIGKDLLQRLVDVLQNPDEWNHHFKGTRLFDYKPRQLMAVMAIDIDMPGSGLKLRDWYLKHGFEQRAHLKEVGWKKERWIDTVYLQLTLRG